MDSVESTHSLWKGQPLPIRPSLDRDAQCDVCIVGAGIAGLSVAYRMAREGQRVIVLDAHDIGAGETAQTSAHLASALDDRFSVLERMHGKPSARLAFESHARAIGEIESIVDEESIDCEFARVNGYLFRGDGQDGKLLDDEWETVQRLGIPGVERLERAPLEGFDSGPCLVFARQARFHPLRYLAGLARAIEQRGGRLHARTRVTSVKGGAAPTVRTADGFEVRARAVVVATNSPVHLRLAIHTKQAPYRTYAIAIPMPKGSVPDALFWDTSDPYHYVRIEPTTAGVDHLIVGGEDQRTATSDDAEARYQRLAQWTRAHFPGAKAIAYRWSGQVLEPFDSLAFIGRDPSGERNVYVATGDSGHGLTHGALAGILIADLIAKRDNPWAALYEPSRKTVRAVPEFVHDSLEVAAEYAQWLKPDGKRRDVSLARGEGTVVQRGKRKVALYRDARGELHERSAVCTHLGCVVRWNSDAKSWDCGCHGSRFAPTGEVLNGPAFQALAHPEDSEVSLAQRAGSAAVGALGGAVATVAMTACLLAAKELGLLGRLPPKKIVRGLRLRLGMIGMSRGAENAVTTAAHVGFGVTAGSLYGLAQARSRGVVRSALTGGVYGLAIWTTSYYGWVPALGLMRAPHRDRAFRPAAMIAGHLVFGSVLGAFVALVRGAKKKPSASRAPRPRRASTMRVAAEAEALSHRSR